MLDRSSEQQSPNIIVLVGIVIPMYFFHIIFFTAGSSGRRRIDLARRSDAGVVKRRVGVEFGVRLTLGVGHYSNYLKNSFIHKQQ